jgi:flagellar biosynthesis/type III secretory pathway ATPase
MLPRLLERSGRTAEGSITGFYTVLVEGDDESDPVAESARAILDGHLVLSRELAERAHWPAIDVLASISRSMNDVTTPEHQRLAEELRRVLSARRDADDLVSVGAYAAGSNPQVDAAIRHEADINSFLRQLPTEINSLPQTLELMARLTEALGSVAAPESAATVGRA